ncbi:MAG: hypothetical protein CO021_06050 [Deltaproteobacteria bacterium CG_4_9_14_0_2_um_filter_42_21]|nr:MAG: hypothetical protein CO021_06050 [Deltaproteobacteria bacterium CG_4_9_14_0_2_um_filter_42_21]
MQVFRKNTIAKKLMFYIVIFSSIVTLFLTAIQLYRDYVYEVKSLEKRISQLEQSHLGRVNTI